MAEQYVTKILQIRDAPQLNLMGGVKQFKAVDFTIDGQSAHTVVIPLEEFTVENVRARVEEQAQKMRALLTS